MRHNCCSTYYDTRADDDTKAIHNYMLLLFLSLNSILALLSVINIMALHN